MVMKGAALRGKAWVVFADVGAATDALRAMQDFPFFDKPLVRGVEALGWWMRVAGAEV